MNPDYRITLYCVTERNVSLITGEDGNGNLIAEAMIAFMTIALLVSVFLLNSNRIQKAIEICRECLILLNSTDQNSKDIFIVLFSKMLFALYIKSGNMLQTLGENLKAKEYFERALAIAKNSLALLKIIFPWLQERMAMET